MRKFILFTTMLSLIAVSAYFLMPTNGTTEATANVEKVEESKMPKDLRIAGGMDYRMDRLKNPATGVFDPADYKAAVEQADAMKAAAAHKKSGVLGLEWEAIGPDNVGGRTRAVLFDKDDPNLIFAAGVAGGIYKTTNGGEDWAPLDTYTGFATVVSITQANDGTIYVGTGEGLSQISAFNGGSGQVGDGIYMSSDKGDTWQAVTSTVSGTDDVSNGADFAAVNDLEISPVNSSVLMAANNAGLFVSSNADQGVNMTFTEISGVSGTGQAVEIAPDGSFAMAAFGGRVFRSDDVVGNFQTWNQVVGAGGTANRADVVISPSNPNYVYVSKSAGNFCLQGLYRSTDGGISFMEIVEGGAPYLLDPFNQPSADFGVCQGQGWYDHTIEVNPVDENKLYIGGIAFYTWGAGTGGLKKADDINGDFFDTDYIHADKHEIVFSPHDPTGNTFIIGNDGGLVLCENALSGFPDNMVFRDINKNYNTLTVYSMGAGRFGEVLGGAQDNGTQYIDYLGSSIQGSFQVSGGDGGWAEVSNLDYNVMFGASQNGNINRSINRGGSANAFVDDNIDGNACGHIHCSNNAVCGEGDAPFITPFFLMETSNRSNPPMTAFISAPDDTLLLSTGDTLIVRETIQPGTVMAQSGNIPSIEFPVTLNSPIEPGDTVFFEDPFDAKYFVSTSCGIWMCKNPLSVSEQACFYRFSASGGARNYDASADGDNLYTVTGGNTVTIYTGLNSLSLPGCGCDSENSACVTGYGTLNISVGSNLQLEGIAVDKNDPNTVLVTSSGFGNFSHVFRIENALSGTPTVVPLQTTNATLPFMPVYNCEIDFYNSDRYIVSSELGIWTSDDAGATWSEDNDGMGIRMPIFSLRQEWLNSKWGIDNFNEDCYALYAGTHARGMFATGSLSPNGCFKTFQGDWPGEVTSIDELEADVEDLQLYPNPVTDVADVVFDLRRPGNVKISLVDFRGSVVHTQVYPRLQKGMNALTVIASDLAAGNYIAVVSVNDKPEGSVKFIKN